MKNRKRILNFFHITECDALSIYLEEMAAKGWILEKITYLFIRFYRAEPCKTRFYAMAIGKAPLHKTDTNYHVDKIIEYCDETEWKYYCGYGKLRIFNSEQENAAPIETDEQLKFDNIRHAYRSLEINRSIIIYFILIYCLIEWLIEDSIYELFSSSSSTILILLLLIPMYKFIKYLIWCKQAKRQLYKGDIISSEHNKTLINRIKYKKIIYITLCIALYFTSIFYIYSSIHKIVSNAPVTFETLGFDVNEDIHIYGNSSIFYKSIEVTCYPDYETSENLDLIDYSVVKSNFKWIRDLYINHKFNEFNKLNKKIKSEPPMDDEVYLLSTRESYGAIEVYESNYGVLIYVFDDCILCIDDLADNDNEALLEQVVKTLSKWNP